jgi:CRP/FNR family transcriptional regulator, cyclic AMP receptor protein
MLTASLLADDSRIVRVHAGAKLFVQGGKSNMMFVLLSGQARILVNDIEVERLAIGDPVGELALIDYEPHSATVEAITECKFAGVDERTFYRLVAGTPEFALDLMRTLARRLRNTDKML